MKHIENLHAITVKHLPATNFKGSRFKMISERFGDSVTKSYDYAHNSVLDMATEWLQAHNQIIIGKCETRTGSLVILKAQENAFTPLKDMVI